jgi:hypothetical protein
VKPVADRVHASGRRSGAGAMRQILSVDFCKRIVGAVVGIVVSSGDAAMRRPRVQARWGGLDNGPRATLAMHQAATAIRNGSKRMLR